MKKKWIILIVAFVIIAVFLVVAKKNAWIGKQDIKEVSLAQVSQKNLIETVVASGRIQPELEIKISSEVSGEIIELPIIEGEKVEKGQLLLKINPDIYEAAANRARAAVNSSKAAKSSAKAQFIEAEKNYNRNKKLFEQKVISASDFDAIQRAYDVALLQIESSEYQLQSAMASLKEAEDNQKRTTIFAPQSGTISRLDAEAGERVVGTAQMAGTEILRIADLESMEVLVEVNENDIVRVSKGDTAIVEVDAYFGDKFKGIVTEIANSARNTTSSADQVTNFEVKIRVLKVSYEHLLKEGGNGSPFRPGMTASVEINTQVQKDALVVPIEAVTVRQDTSTKAKSYRNKYSGNEESEEFEVVFLYKEGKAVLQVVKTGIQDDDFIQILEGLEVDQEVISGPYSIVSKDLINSDAVKAKSKFSSKEKE